MRSAIFDKGPGSVLEGRRQPRSLFKNSPNTSTSSQSPSRNKKSKPPSPYVGSLSKYSKRNESALSWNLGDMVSTYQEHGILPPILSPTIPQAEKIEKNKKNPIGNDSKVDTTNEDLPISMLSPTLPVIFGTSQYEKSTTNSYSNLAQPKPTSVSSSDVAKLVDMSINEKNSPKTTVRWINKSQDKTHPKFLLKITFASQKNIRNSFTEQERSIIPQKYNGLGISTMQNDTFAEKADRSSQHKDTSNEEKPMEDQDQEIEKSRTKEDGKSMAKDINHESKTTEERRKEVQLKELNRDVFEKRKTQSKALERIRIEKTQTPVFPRENKILSTDAKREEYKQNLTERKSYWMKMAHTAKTESDNTNDPTLSLIINMDSLLLYMIAYDYDEKLKLVSELLPSDRYWNSLYQECSKMISQIKQQNSVSKHKLKYSISEKPTIEEYTQFFVGLLYQIKSIILKRINTIFQKVIDSYIIKNNNLKSNDLINELNSKIIELQKSTIGNYNKSITNFAKAQSILSTISPVSSNFPKTWYNKSPQINPIQVNENSFVPGGDNYFLPIGMYSELREISGFTFSCLREFSELFLSAGKDSNSNMKYELQSRLKGAPDDNGNVT